MSPISFVFVELSLWALFSVLWALVGWYSRPSLVVLSLMMVFGWSAFSGFIRWVRRPYGSGRSFALLHFCGLVVSCCGVCTVILYFVWCIDGLARLALLFVSILVWCVHGRGKQNSMDTLLNRPREANGSKAKKHYRIRAENANSLCLQTARKPKNTVDSLLKREFAMLANGSKAKILRIPC